MPPEDLSAALQAAYAGSSRHPSPDAHIQKRWLLVAGYVRSGISEKHDKHALAVELHLVFIGEGHRTEIVNRTWDDPVLAGWHAVAQYVIGAGARD